MPCKNYTIVVTKQGDTETATVVYNDTKKTKPSSSHNK